MNNETDERGKKIHPYHRQTVSGSRCKSCGHETIIGSAYCRKHKLYTKYKLPKWKNIAEDDFIDLLAIC